MTQVSVHWKPMIRLCLGIAILTVIGAGVLFLSADVPETVSLNYADPYTWYATGTAPEAAADIFYLYGDVDVLGLKPTAVTVDVSRYEIRLLVHDTIQRSLSAYPPGMNVYVPYYRQTTAYDSTTAAEIAADFTAYADAKAAFRQYFMVWNNDRPYYLAGSGQGAEYVSRLVTEWFGGNPRYLKNLEGVYLDGVLQDEEDVLVLINGSNVTWVAGAVQ